MLAAACSAACMVSVDLAAADSAAADSTGQAVAITAVKQPQLEQRAVEAVPKVVGPSFAQLSDQTSDLFMVEWGSFSLPPFKERTQASDFNAALHEHAQYMRRKKEAQENRQAYESTADDGESGGSSSSQSELSLKPGETITLKLGKVSHAANLHYACRQGLGFTCVVTPA